MSNATRKKHGNDKQVEKIKKKNALSAVDSGINLMNQNPPRYDDAEKLFDEALKIYPNFPNALYNKQGRSNNGDAESQ